MAPEIPRPKGTKPRPTRLKTAQPPYVEKQIHMARGLAAQDSRLPPLDNKTAKLHKMVRLLEKHSQGLSIQNLSTTLGVDERTVKRYLSDIRRLEHNLVSLRTSERKLLYHIPKEGSTPKHFLPGLKKIRSELHAGGNPKYTPLISQLIRFLEDEDEAKRELEGLQEPSPATEAYYIDHGPFAETDPPPGILRLLEAAIASHSAVRLDYSGYAPEKGEFLFFPYALSLRVGTLYLIGRQGQNRGAFKSLSVKRIKRCMATKESFTPDAFDPAEYYKYCFGQWARQANENPETVLLALHAPWLEKYLSESHFHPPGKIIRKGKDACFELKIVIKPDFVNWVMSLTPNLTPVKPESLRKEVLDRLRRALAKSQP